MAQSEYTNIHGRRQTRGVRPWLLIPKIIAVALYIGGLGSAAAITFATNLPGLDADAPRRLWLVAQLRVLAFCVIVPALLAALILGIALLLQHPRVFLKQRWLQIKLVLVLIGVPLAHWSVSSRLTLVRVAYESHRINADADRQLPWALVAVLAGSITVMILGRLKPRLP